MDKKETEYLRNVFDVKQKTAFSLKLDLLKWLAKVIKYLGSDSSVKKGRDPME